MAKIKDRVENQKNTTHRNYYRLELLFIKSPHYIM